MYRYTYYIDVDLWPRVITLQFFRRAYMPCYASKRNMSHILLVKCETLSASWDVDKLLESLIFLRAGLGLGPKIKRPFTPAKQ